MVTLKIDGQKVTVRKLSTILDAARKLDIPIPTLCHHPALSPFGGCRLCLVEIKGSPKPVTSCTTFARDGMEVKTTSPQLENMRKMTLELLLSDHPTDCMVCERAGDCKLQELAYFYGSEGGHILQVLRETYRIGKSFNHQGTDRDIKGLFKWMKDQLNQPYKSHKCKTFVWNLLKEKNNLFEFVKNPEVDGTNNAAERALRPAVIARKVSGGSRSEKGAKNYEILMSVVQTLHQNGKNLVDHGSDILLTSYG